jgi:tRNA (guanine26-N2/guanine27-N2)-dimethyltransferase
MIHTSWLYMVIYASTTNRFEIARSQANFKKVQSATSKALASGVARFLPNPEEFWGPKPRAGRHLTSKHIASHGAEFVNGTLRAEGKPPIETPAAAAADEAPDAKRQKLDE